MKALIQRVKSASVIIDKNTICSINEGFLILLGVAKTDIPQDVKSLVKKIINLRIFPNENKGMHKSLKDVQGSALIVSQFTLYGNCNKGRRPSFTNAAKSELAKPLYLDFINKMKQNKIDVQSGIFGSDMDICIVNNGPVTIMLES